MDACGWDFVKVMGRFGHQSSYLPAFSDGNAELIIEIKEVVKRSENKKQPSDGVFFHERYSYSPTGKLQFSIVNVFSGGLQKTWSDNSKSMLEEHAE